VTLFEHVQGYATFANQGQKVGLSVIREVDDASGKSVYSHGTPGGTTVLTPAEAYMITGVLKDYQNQWGFGWNRQMASKTGTSDNGRGGIPDSWIMAYNPDIVAGVWVGNTAPNGGGGLITAYGEQVGKTVMKRFVNALPAGMRDWYSQPAGITRGCNGQNTQYIFLAGGCNATPSSSSPTASPSASPSVSPSSSPSASASPSPSTIPSPSSAPTPPASPSAAPTGSPAPPSASPTPT
jgi:membrane peptidoglycan carboxypeptidase